MQLSKNKKKNYRYLASFSDGLHVEFGKNRVKHLTDHKDVQKATLYYQKHRSILKTCDHRSHQYLEWFVLNGGTDIKQNVAFYNQLLRKRKQRKSIAAIPHILEGICFRTYRRKCQTLNLPYKVSYCRGCQVE